MKKIQVPAPAVYKPVAYKNVSVYLEKTQSRKARKATSGKSNYKEVCFQWSWWPDDSFLQKYNRNKWPA